MECAKKHQKPIWPRQDVVEGVRTAVVRQTRRQRTGNANPKLREARQKDVFRGWYM